MDWVISRIGWMCVLHLLELPVWQQPARTPATSLRIGRAGQGGGGNTIATTTSTTYHYTIMKISFVELTFTESGRQIVTV